MSRDGRAHVEGEEGAARGGAARGAGGGAPRAAPSRRDRARERAGGGGARAKFNMRRPEDRRLGAHDGASAMVRAAGRTAPARVARVLGARASRRLSSAGAPAGARFSTRAVVACSASAGVAAALAARHYLRRDAPPPHNAPDGSRARVAVSPQAPRVVRVLYRDEDGAPHVAALTEQQFTAEQRRVVASLEAARGPLAEACAAALRERLAAAFAECQGAERVAAFASWYYAYGTTYELTRVALVAAAAAVPSAAPPREAAAEAVAERVLAKYAAIVLRPAVSEPALRRAFERAAADAHAAVLRRLGALHAEALPLLQRHTTHLDGADGGGPRAPAAALDVDWGFARRAAAGVDTAHGRRSAEGAAALLGGGALAGKAAGAAAAKGLVGGAAKALGGKLAAPFVAKASLPLGGAISASAGGPVGAAVGAGVGLAVDFALAKGVELLGRRELEADVASALRTAQAEWAAAMEAELGRLVGVLLDDAAQLVAADPG